MSTFQIFPNFGRGGGVIKNQIFPKFKIVHIILENYGLFPQFVTFHVWMAPLTDFSICNEPNNSKMSKLR